MVMTSGRLTSRVVRGQIAPRHSRAGSMSTSSIATTIIRPTCSPRSVRRRGRRTAAERAVDLSKPVYLRLYGKLTKQTGFAVLGTDRVVKRLLLADAAVARLTKADSANRVRVHTESLR